VTSPSAGTSRHPWPHSTSPKPDTLATEVL
jgi:hypothetical protein